MFQYFQKMIVLKYQDSTTEKFFENSRRNLSFWGGGETNFKKKIGSGPNMEDSPNLYFMFFDRYEIQIQPCVLFSNGKCIIVQSSSPQKIFSGKIRTYFSKQNGGHTFQTNRKFQNFQILRYPKIIFFKDDSMIFLVIFEVFWW